MAEGLYAVAYLELGAEVEEHDLPLPSLLPLQLYGDAEEEMAQAAAAIVRCISLRASSGLEDAGTVLLEQGIIAIDAKRTVAPADSRIEAPMRILLEVMISAKQIEAEFPRLRQVQMGFRAGAEAHEVIRHAREARFDIGGDVSFKIHMTLEKNISR